MSSTTDQSEIGLFGLGVMGQNLALNIADKGFTISVHNRTTSKVDTTVEMAKEQLKERCGNLRGHKDLKEFVQSLSVPRKIIVMVNAGRPVDMVLDELIPLMDRGDLIIDGGNEWYENTERRVKRATESGMLYLGMGVSGGEEGARYGPSLMPGGSKEGYDLVSNILEKVAARSDSGPCVTYIGPGGSGHYVKMVHNGIEYGDMELIAEVYEILRHVGHMNNEDLHRVFSEWNQGELKSFLIEITATIFKKKDDRPGQDGYLVDKVLDKSGSKGTGKWTVQEAASRGVAVPTIAAALDMRMISTLKQERIEASKKLHGVPPPKDEIDRQKLVEELRNALYASKICSYAQGMNIIQQASHDFNWNLNFGEIARIWKAGCIIRAVFLDRITKAYKKTPDLKSLLMDDEFAQEINERQVHWRNVVSRAIQHAIPVQALSSSLAYYDAYRRERLPANLIQAQRDYFGAHTYQRVDDGEDGDFVHSHWASE